jgi:hypothetical protein
MGAGPLLNNQRREILPLCCFISLVNVLSLFLIAGCAVHDPRLQQYDANEVYSYLRQYGFKGDGIHYFWQDSEGRVLYFGDGDLEDRVPGHTVFLLREDRDEPIRVTIPPATYEDYWIDPQGNLRFLPPYLPSVEKRVVENIYDCVDRQSPYFTEETRDGNVHVGSFTRPDGWLFSVPKPVKVSWLLEITGKENAVYLEDNEDADRFPFQHNATNCWVFSPDPKDHARYIKVDEFSVAGVIVAIDPCSSLCICREYGMYLFDYRHFLFDAKTRKKLGYLSDNDIAAFLDTDWLGPRLARVKHSKPARSK